jgi:hypothetical protein
MKFRTIEAPNKPVKRGRGRPPKSESLDTTPVYLVHGRTKEGPMPMHRAIKLATDAAYDGASGKTYDIVPA